MCGIAGYWTPEGAQDVRRDVLERMVASLRHRGPDDEGFHVARRAGIGMTRLSIIDVSGGHQPISSEDGMVTVVCNGEIYNHNELREELMARGHVFKTRSDVEVIVHLYEEVGARCIQRLRGMFAVALWDERNQRLLVARDRLGIKPLFFARHAGGLQFASEMKAIVKGALPSVELDTEALDRYLTFGYIPTPLTIYREIRKLDPGHLMIADASGVKTERYWELRFEPIPDADEVALGRRFVELFEDAVRSHLMSDVSLGAFLSGGVDSSLVVALMAEMTSTPVKTFTIGFGGGAGGHMDERPYARMLSERYGTQHTEFEVQPNLEEVLDHVVDAFDEPFADDSVIPTYYICKLARQSVTVALTGLGGDELFGGYERHLGLKLSARYDRVPSFVRRRMIGPLVNSLPERRDGHYTINHLKRFVRAAELPAPRRYLNYVTVFNEALKRRVCVDHALDSRGYRDAEDTRHFESAAASDLVDRALNHDINTYLPEDILALSDRLSMQNSLELRVPFLDHPLVEFCATIPSSLKIRATTKKYLLRRVARRFLPDEVLDHRKQGFASPMTSWLRTDLKDYVRSTLAPERLARHNLFNPEAVSELIDAHMTRRETYDRQLFALMMFQKWHERFM
jgi:asparagine synthase (glutamine-hydrolysing)